MSQIPSLPCLAVQAGVEADEDWSMSLALFEPDGVTPTSLAGLTLTASLTPECGGGSIYESADDIVVSGTGSNILTLTVLAEEKASWAAGVYAFEILATDGTRTCELVDRSKSMLKVGRARFLSVVALRSSGSAVMVLPVSTPAGIAAQIATLPAPQLQALAAALPLVGSEFSKTAAFTPSAPGTYFLNASDIPMTIPATNIGGDILIVDKTGNPSLTIIGTLLNGLPVLGPNGTFALRWSALYSGYFWK